MLYDDIQLEGIKKAEDYLLDKIQKRWDRRDRLVNIGFGFIYAIFIMVVLWVWIRG